MKHFGVYRKLILIAGTVIAAVSVGSVFFMENTSALMLFVICAFAILCGLLFLLDFLHNRYHDDLLEQITLLIEALVEQQERIVFPENEDTLTARLQHQLLKLRNILTAQNQMLAQEKEQIKTLISDISHQIKTPVSAANTFAQLLDDKELSDEERSEYIATLQTSLEKLTFEITEYPSYLRLDISDNGIGIPEEEQAKIFGRFYRGKQSAGIDGVGIGLYLTRDIINKQKGYIKVASDENGSVFSLFLKKD
ncbi:MAG: sensor histidine kinase [[Eubacterium] rectale]|nr:sensor histidine kinase [Agathobacter rectalis]